MTDRKHTPRGIAFHNPEPGVVPQGAPKNMVKAEFGNRLHRYIMLAGMNQSDLAKAASACMPSFIDPETGDVMQKKIGRDSVSSYVRGKQLPGPVHLKAMCDALGVSRDDLLPPLGVPSTATTALPAFNIHDVGDGMVLVQVNQMLPFDAGLEIGAIVRRYMTGKSSNGHAKEE
jgi:transcriptional regulator with XRE-family HTH domain